jgi:hypothetical protein
MLFLFPILAGMKNIIQILFLCFVGISNLLAQPEVYPWGNISGIRLDGELMELNSSLNLVGADWSDVKHSDKEVGQYQYRRVNNTQFTNLSLDNFLFDQSVEALGAGQANVRINFRNQLDTAIIGSFFKLALPVSKYDVSTLQLGEPKTIKPGEIPEAPGVIGKGRTKELIINGETRNLKVTVNEETHIMVRKDPSDENSPIEIIFALMTGQMEKGTSSFRSFHISATGVADLTPITLTLDQSKVGRPFKGFGGNFRLQNPVSDPPVIDYCLENMDVRWGRVEMPWRFWHPEEADDPLSKAQRGEIHPRVKASMEMAQRLHNLGMPVILSDWSAPEWAIEGRLTWGPQPGGVRGNPLDQTKSEQIYKSIADYIQYVKDNYGFEFVMFSFNESDLGINVRQTPEEHAKLIKELGAYLESRGIKTKLLLGDTADVNGWPFVDAAIDDPATHPYIGAVSFHSWRGYTDENLKRWLSAAEKMNLPLLIGEGSMDAGAWRYPDIFSEPMYAMEEMNLYVRILKICQPESILQWQLTADYSPMSGGGVFGETNAPLSPTQRFWNFKQIADMPEGLSAMPVNADRDNVICAALGDLTRKMYVIHIVNNGASRPAILKGLPADVRRVKVFVTNERTSMAEQRSWVRNGEANFYISSNSFVTLRVDGESPFRGL